MAVNADEQKKVSCKKHQTPRIAEKLLWLRMHSAEKNGLCYYIMADDAR